MKKPKKLRPQREGETIAEYARRLTTKRPYNKRNEKSEATKLQIKIKRKVEPEQPTPEQPTPEPTCLDPFDPHAILQSIRAKQDENLDTFLNNKELA